MKILLSAYSCAPTMISEPGVGWRAVQHALRGHEVWTIIKIQDCERPIRDHLAAHPMPGFHPVFMDVSAPVRALRKSGATRAFCYHLWQHKLLRTARDLHARVGFDLAQHVTFARYWSPSGLRDLGIPFIWGPVGAAESTPPSFRAELPLRARAFEYVRDRVRAAAHRDPALRATARAATIALGHTLETCEALRRLGARRVQQLPLALDDGQLEALERAPLPPPGPFRVLCLGRLLHWKGFHLAIRAFALFARKSPEAELWIAGEGPFRNELEKTADQNGVASRVRFLGHLSHPAAMDRLAQAHVLVHPALHEGFGTVCLEAMASGRPVVCLDLGGPAVQVTAETGFVAPATTPEEAVPAMASYLVTIDQNRALLAETSVRCRARVRAEFTMNRTGAALDACYAEAVALHGELRRSAETRE
jgi:glycosyltransferase involved in cell wall biosynthesis